MASGDRRGDRAIRRGRLVLAIALAVIVGACGGGLSSAKSDYKRGRLPEAKNELVALEQDARTWPTDKRAEYDLYRGLVHLGLGDRTQAGVWLREAKAIVDVDPSTLSSDDRARLDTALDSLVAAE